MAEKILYRSVEKTIVEISPAVVDDDGEVITPQVIETRWRHPTKQKLQAAIDRARTIKAQTDSVEVTSQNAVGVLQRLVEEFGELVDFYADDLEHRYL